MRTTPGTRTEHPVDDNAEYIADIQEWRETLQNAAEIALAVKDMGEEERANLERALRSLDSIGGLVRLVVDPYVQTLDLVDERGEPTWLNDGTADFDKMMDIVSANAGNLTVHGRQHVAHGLAGLQGVIGSAFIVGSHGVKNAVNLRKMQDRAAVARERKRPDDVEEVVHRHRDILWSKKTLFSENKLGTAKQIRDDVNADLAKMGIDPLTENAIRKRL